jgi:3-hydroxybutyryl-CoA dehydrogenase
MTVAVIGAGTMGAGIAQVSAAAGHQVCLFDRSKEARQRGLKAIHSSLDRFVKKGQLSEAQKGEILERIQPIDDLAPLGSADIVIEAVFEKLSVKLELWPKLAAAASERALLASNTSSLSVTEIAAATGAAERFCGLHFFNPVPVLPLVEVVRGLRTTDDAIERAKAFVTGIGKTPIVTGDKPGFIVNRLLVPYMVDAVQVYSEGLASAEDIDTAMKLGANMPIGPLALCDLVGIDVALAAAESLYFEFGDPKFRVPPLVRQMVRAGKLGRKTGEGFYKYDERQ